MRATCTESSTLQSTFTRLRGELTDWPDRMVASVRSLAAHVCSAKTLRIANSRRFRCSLASGSRNSCHAQSSITAPSSVTLTRSPNINLSALEWLL
ncbi:hypothetical protein D3C71_1957720 [compost metagenome]